MATSTLTPPPTPTATPVAASARPRPTRRRLLGPALPLAALGFVLVVGLWYLTVDVLELPRFRALPGPTEVVGEWFAPDPAYGTSVFTPVYYDHIWASVKRVGIAFCAALATGIPLGLALGWSTRVRQYAFPVFELVRPIPILAWVPFAILMFQSSEAPVVFLTYLAAFYAATLNTMLGVQSIDPNLVDRKSTRLNSSHANISYAVFCLKKK